MHLPGTFLNPRIRQNNSTNVSNSSVAFIANHIVCLLDVERSCVLERSSIMSAAPDVAALDSQKATLLDGAPLCAAVLDAEGKPKVVNKVFVELMGPLFKFSNYEFSEAASKSEGKASLKAAIKAVCSGASPRERLSNIEMLTHARWPCLAVKTHFDWFVGSSEGPGEASLCWRGHAVLYGYPCSPEVLEQREKV